MAAVAMASDRWQRGVEALSCLAAQHSPQLLSPGLATPPGLGWPAGVARKVQQQPAVAASAPARPQETAGRGSAKERSSKHAATFTTVMLCSLNAHDDTVDVVRILQTKGWENTFNFCQKPRQSKQSCCKPYAFINFKTHEMAARFKKDTSHGFQVEIADVQGLDANLKGWARSNFREGGKIKSNGVHDRRLWPWVEDASLWQRYHSKGGPSSGRGGSARAKEPAAACPTRAPAVAIAGHRRAGSEGSTASGSSSTDSPSATPAPSCRAPSPVWSPRSEVQIFLPNPMEPAKLVLRGFDDM